MGASRDGLAWRGPFDKLRTGGSTPSTGAARSILLILLILSKIRGEEMGAPRVGLAWRDPFDKLRKGGSTPSTRLTL